MPPSKLSTLRSKIDQVDARIVKLLGERARLAVRVGEAKKKNKKQTYAPDREQSVLSRIVRLNNGSFPSHALRSIYREVLSACRALQSPLTVAYLGPEATFTHSASLKQFGQSTQMIPGESITAVFEAVESGEAEFGVVPIENSTEGVITHTLDQLLESPLQICGEILMPITHCLLGQKRGIKPQQIYTHSQATAQCRVWLERNYPKVPVTQVASTGRAAQLAAKDPKAYAIGSELAAKPYGLKVLRRGIEDNPQNMTRFLTIGRTMPKRSGDDKTSLVFSVRDEAGVLYKMLEPFHKAGINLSKIESRPMVRLKGQKAKSRSRAGKWEYAFFLDLDGHISAPKVQKAVAQLEKKCLYLKILGSYPRGK